MGNREKSQFKDYFDSLTLENLLNEKMIHKAIIRKYPNEHSIIKWCDDLDYIESKLGVLSS